MKVVKDRKRTYYVVILILTLFFIAFIVQSFRHSLFFERGERINFLVYGKNTSYYSLGVSDNLNYNVPFYNDLQIQIPGGRKYYRIGAIGKLVSLEKKPVLFQQTFSLITSSFVDFYFYPEKSEIYYGGEVRNAVSPSVRDIIFLKSNAYFFDRLYLVLKIVGKRSQDFNTLSRSMNSSLNAITMSSMEFAKQYQGYFYHKDYRSEQKNVQIFYKRKGFTAQMLGQILEGSGIRVADISQTDATITACSVTEKSSSNSQTARDIAAYFHCQSIKGKTGVYDILFVLGSLESDWEVENQ